ncbi:hypothetical protein ASPZODRAFT_2119698 [Penicilliopsis zonata CBS 506.65]|uniref:Uncharacterized protein n=1 Tax=Penicilliopsis zonata CBS 506.65 TaxID=1073090 RepID=A0A1L9S5Y6_9EURO|nr:hypothetical protein ASPZODRAFT_2119698 [Penicilliopsis zonata CBS 506.65]OJJ42572.1 hypothetical protein ASPZODRAFT_2119698 [Penicilliopsis zonata CBS 506.65]
MAMATHPPEVQAGLTTFWLPISEWKYVPTSLVAWDPGYGIWVQPGLLCQPPQMTSWWDANHILSQVDLHATQLSIGPVVCPDAYTTATTSVNEASSTLVACCPSSYDFVEWMGVGNTGECSSQLHVGQVIEYVLSDVVASTWSSYTSTVNTASLAYAIPVNGWLFPTSTEKATFISTSTEKTTFISTSTGTTTPISTSTAAAQTHYTIDSTNSIPPRHSNLTTADTVGIAVGSSAGILAVCLVLLAVLRRQRKRNISSDKDDPSILPPLPSRPPAGAILVEVQAKSMSELPERDRAELPGVAYGQ